MLQRIRIQEIQKIAKEKQQVVIVGAGSIGRYIALRFKKNGISPSCFFDNDEQKRDKLIEGVHVRDFQKLQGNVLYIISVVNISVANELYHQLLTLGVKKYDVVALPDRTKIYEYRSSLSEEEYQDEIDLIYYQQFGKLMNWENPQTYNEKINWEKINIKDSRKIKLADKYLVREFVKEKIGIDYLTCLYGVWDSVEDIDFDKLPNRFVLKTNNGSGRNIIVPDKSIMHKDEIVAQLEKWCKENFAYCSFEMQYKDIDPKIICEEYLEGVAENLYDYDVYCFHGEPKYIWCINGSHRENCKAAFYDLGWNKQPFSYGYPYDEEMAPKPEFLNKMIELSRMLAKDFEHARIDWYQFPASKNGLLFSEITFSTWGGLNHFRPAEYDLILGEMI